MTVPATRDAPVNGGWLWIAAIVLALGRPGLGASWPWAIS
jgi:hypothetical protein